jgi:WD40 repeat protein
MKDKELSNDSSMHSRNSDSENEEMSNEDINLNEDGKIYPKNKAKTLHRI